MEVPRSKSKSKAYRRGCIFYFFLYMSYGSIVPYLPLIWRDKGFSGERVHSDGGRVIIHCSVVFTSRVSNPALTLTLAHTNYRWEWSLMMSLGCNGPNKAIMGVTGVPIADPAKYITPTL